MTRRTSSYGNSALAEPRPFARARRGMLAPEPDMKLVVPGGTGQLGALVTRAFRARGHEVVVLSREGSRDTGVVEWDARTLGEWASQLDGADAVLNLAGRSVNCRYTEENLKLMLDSRVESTRAVGLAITRAKRPPSLWLQMSTATIYAHRFDAANDEASGLIGGSEPGVPPLWGRSIEIAKAWERAQTDTNTPHTRKLLLRSAMVLSPARGGVFDVLLGLARRGLGGPIAGGRQFVSWIHDRDFVRALEFLIERKDLDGAVNLASPNPLPQREFMRVLREAWGARVGLPATAWMAAAGALFLRTETELVLKSRRVVPGRLLKAGFSFDFPELPGALADLVERWRKD
jgi:uncharacterized protein